MLFLLIVKLFVYWECGETCMLANWLRSKKRKLAVCLFFSPYLRSQNFICEWSPETRGNWRDLRSDAEKNYLVSANKWIVLMSVTSPTAMQDSKSISFDQDLNMFLADPICCYWTYAIQVHMLYKYFHVVWLGVSWKQMVVLCFIVCESEKNQSFKRNIKKGRYRYLNSCKRCPVFIVLLNVDASCWNNSCSATIGYTLWY